VGVEGLRWNVTREKGKPPLFTCWEEGGLCFALYGSEVFCWFASSAGTKKDGVRRRMMEKAVVIYSKA